MMDADQRRQMARAMCAQLAQATGPVVVLLPNEGGNEWDRPGGPLHDAEAFEAFKSELRAQCPANVTLIELDAHINDDVFSDTALQVFDGWLADGTVSKG